MLGKKMKSSPLVSIVIPTYNSEKTLVKCLESIKRQTYKNIEIIIVDRNSRDKTVEIAKRYGTRVYQIDAERAKARNFGISKAKGTYLLSIDSDMELTPRVVEECLERIESNKKIGGIIIPERSVGSSFWVKVRDFERRFYVGTEVESARFFRMSLVKRVGGYDDDLVSFEESTLPQKMEKLGYNVKVRIKSYILHHEEHFSLAQWLKKKHYYGRTARKYLTKYRDYGIKQANILKRLKIFLKNKEFYSKPTLALGVLVLKTLEYIFATTGFLFNILRRV